MHNSPQYTYLVSENVHMKSNALFMKVSITLFLCLTYASLQAQSWEAHLNLRGIQKLIEGESASFLIKKKIGEQTYIRLNVNGYLAAYKQVGNFGNNILISSSSIGLRPGIERRSELSKNIFFLRGTDLIYQYSATVNTPPTTVQYSLDQKGHTLGMSPFIGLHFTINQYIGILAESHLDASQQTLSTIIRNDDQSPQPNRTEVLKTWSVGFQPFQYLTICLTF